MTRDERVAAFQMRLDGKSWAQIGAALGYEPDSVAIDLKRCIQRGPRHPVIVYPAIAAYITAHCGGSIYQFAGLCGLRPGSVYDPLAGRCTVSQKMAEAVCAATGLTYEEAFRRNAKEET